MTKNEREQLIEELAESLTDSADEKTLESYFRDGQIDWLESLSEEELLEQKVYFLGEDNE